MTPIQLLFLNGPVILIVWFLLWFLGLAFTLRLMDTKNPVYVICINMTDRIRELYELGVVVALASMAVSTLTT